MMDHIIVISNDSGALGFFLHFMKSFITCIVEPLTKYMIEHMIFYHIQHIRRMKVPLFFFLKPDFQLENASLITVSKSD